METNNPLDVLVGALSKQILDQVSARVDIDLQSTIESKLRDVDVAARVDMMAKSEARVAAAQYQPNLSAIDKQLATATQAIIANITGTANKLVNEAIQNHVKNIDFNSAIITTLSGILENKLTNFDFPDNSVPVTALAFGNTTISGDKVQGGIIKEFASTGIDDKSSNIQVTVLDSHTVIENHLLSNAITIKGTATFDGNIQLNGNIEQTSPGFVSIVNTTKDQVKAELNDDFFADFGRLVFDQIQRDGIDLSKVTLNGNEIVNDKRLGPAITASNLQEVGVLKELQVSGESLLYNTLYTTTRRVGINTLEPNSALTIWDEEIDINIGKRQKGVAFIGSTRDQLIVLGTNSKTNLILNTDGSVTASKLNLGNMSMSSADSPPNYDAPKATVVFNTNPSLGGPLGWVSLGSARWANFGIIE
jgi:hypothetical protein